MHTWQLQEAKAQLSEVIQQAIKEGPQEITLRGKSAVVVMSSVDFHKLQKPQPSFLTFLRQSPLVGVNLEIKRDQNLTRDIDL